MLLHIQFKQLRHRRRFIEKTVDKNGHKSRIQAFNISQVQEHVQ